MEASLGSGNDLICEECDVCAIFLLLFTTTAGNEAGQRGDVSAGCSLLLDCLGICWFTQLRGKLAVSSG